MLQPWRVAMGRRKKLQKRTFNLFKNSFWDYNLIVSFILFFSSCHLYINIDSIKDVSPSGLIMFLPKDHITKLPTPGLRSPLLSCWSRLSKRLTKCQGLLLLTLVVLQRQKIKSLRIKTWCPSETVPPGPWAETDLKSAPLRRGFHGTRRCYVSFQRREATTSPA